MPTATDCAIKTSNVETDLLELISKAEELKEELMKDWRHLRRA